MHWLMGDKRDVAETKYLLFSNEWTERNELNAALWEKPVIFIDAQCKRSIFIWTRLNEYKEPKIWLIAWLNDYTFRKSRKGLPWKVFI